MGEEVALQTPDPEKKTSMILKVLIFFLSFLTTAAFPVHFESREATWKDPNANQAHDKTELTKDLEKIYKSHIESSDLYSQEDADNRNPMAEEMQRKLNMESERLRSRLRHELAELRERLAPSPARLRPAVAGLRERLAPLTQQLQSSLSSGTQDLCGQLRLYLQGLELAEAQAEAGPELYQEAFLWMSQSLDHSSSKVADIISDFQRKFNVVMEEDLREINASEKEGADSGFLQRAKFQVEQESSELRTAAQNGMGALRAELAALLASTQPVRAEVAASVERFCQNAALQSQALHSRMERLLQGRQAEPEEPEEPEEPSASSPAARPVGSLRGDFSVKLSALIQDILHSVQ
ncbi:apolipoprotein A-IV [Betta splendens]|uniref:Apolipoprotein A-IV n=1 Tax=Betta splendens TaxID=158456 RepID=A0A6P7PE27_BETSP|nr:apolipoprotein A-IV [Betta splendens]